MIRTNTMWCMASVVAVLVYGGALTFVEHVTYMLRLFVFVDVFLFFLFLLMLFFSFCIFFMLFFLFLLLILFFFFLSFVVNVLQWPHRGF